MFKEKTLQYLKKKPAIPKNYRGIPTLVKDPNGRESAYPVSFVNLSALKKLFESPGSLPEGETDRAHVEKAPQEFEINMLRCIYWLLLKEVCPEEAIFLQDEYFFFRYSREHDQQ